MSRRDKFLLIGFSAAVVFFAAISIGVNAMTPDVPTSSNTVVKDGRVEDGEYVLRLGPSTLTGFSQQQSIDLGRLACAALDRGMAGRAVAETLGARGLTPQQSRAVIDAAVATYCPGRALAATG